MVSKYIPLTLQALRDGDIDIAFTYERDQEAELFQEGWIQNPELIFNDHFLLVGPKENPAGLNPSDTPEQGFERIAQFALSHPAQPLFLSRDDESATNVKERGISKALVLHSRKALYPSDSLYTLTDHSTYGMLRTKLQSIVKYVIGGDLLRNPCNAVLRNDASKAVQVFMEYVGAIMGKK